MTLNEFIEELKKLQEEGKGDYQVVVQYRDEGGDYAGWDENVEPYTKDNVKQIVLQESIMTRNELIDFLKKNFKPDEEIAIVLSERYGMDTEKRFTCMEVTNHMQYRFDSSKVNVKKVIKLT